MECDYTHLNHNLLVSQLNGHQGCDYKGDYKGGILYKCTIQGVFFIAILQLLKFLKKIKFGIKYERSMTKWSF
jgi:hypothetical protein